MRRRDPDPLTVHTTLRLLPHMFFGRERTDPALPGAVLSTVLRDTLGPDREAAPDPVVELIIESDVRVTILDLRP
ncbi:hypothetical protein ATM97_30470 [Nocardia sp. MH4]|nr:hypothetical protein [Nocardia sp. MH4]